jgi:two-component system cell cycle sensor histidine kinase PleC
VRLVRNRAEAAGLKLEIDFPQLPEIEADYRAVKQVLLNLLSNAIKFTPRAGSVTVRAEVRRDPLGERMRSRCRTPASASPRTTWPAWPALRAGREPAVQDHAGHRPGPGPDQVAGRDARRLAGAWRARPAKGTTVSFILPIRQSEIGQARDFVAA